METMIDHTIEIGRLETALRMEWVELAYNENEDSDKAFTRMFELQKGDK